MTSEIDKLLITIGADITPNLSKQISGIANAIKRLDKVINDANLNKMQQYLGTLSNLTVGGIGVPRGSSSGANKVFSSARGKILRGQTTGSSNVANIGIGTGASNKQDLQNLGILKSQQYYTAINSAKKLKNVYSEIGKTFRTTISEINNGEKVTSKFVKSIGRIALYRTIRRAIQLITQSIQQGLENVRQIDDELDTALKNIKNSATSLSNSLAILISPLIKELTPIIVGLSDAIANLINEISKASAELQGKDSYFKVLTSDTKEWQDELKKAKDNLFEFDRFISLDNKSTYIGVGEEDTSDGEESNWLAKTAVWSITTAINELKTFISWIVSAWDFFIKELKMIMSWYVTLWEGFRDGWITVFQWLSDIWNNIKSFFTSSIPNFFVDVWTGIKKGWSGIFGGYYADGGMLPQTTGSLAMVGEAGAEIVASGSRGTGVTNVEQFTTAMYNALSMYGVARGTDVAFSGDVYMNTSKVGKLVENSAYNEGVRVGHFNKIR